MAAEPLQMSVHAMPAPTLGDAQAQQRTRSGRIKMLLVLLVCAAPVIASYFTYYVVRPDGRTNYGMLVQPQRPLPPDLALATVDGAPVAAESLKGQWLFLVVGAAACDAGCEERLLLQRQLRETLGRDRDRMDKLWLIPDDAPLRPELRAALGDVQALRVSPQALAQWLEPEAGHSLQEHFYVVDPLGNWMMRFPANPDPGRVKRDLTRLLRASAAWDKAGRP